MSEFKIKQEILDNLKYELGSLFYFYFNSLLALNSRYLSDKEEFNQLIEKMREVSPVLATRKSLSNHFVSVKNYSNFSKGNEICRIPKILALESGEPGGYHENILGASIIIESYHLWEEKYRKQISDDIGVEHNNVKSDFWFDAKHYRDSLIHNKKKANKNIKKCTILPKQNEDNILDVSPSFLFLYIDECIKSLKNINIDV